MNVVTGPVSICVSDSLILNDIPCHDILFLKYSQSYYFVCSESCHIKISVVTSRLSRCYLARGGKRGHGLIVVTLLAIFHCLIKIFSPCPLNPPQAKLHLERRLVQSAFDKSIYISISVVSKDNKNKIHKLDSDTSYLV